MKSIQQKRIEAEERKTVCASLTANQRLKTLIKNGHGNCREALRLQEKLKEEAKGNATPKPATKSNKKFDRI